MEFDGRHLIGYTVWLFVLIGFGVNWWWHQHTLRLLKEKYPGVRFSWWWRSKQGEEYEQVRQDPVYKKMSRWEWIIEAFTALITLGAIELTGWNWFF